MARKRTKRPPGQARGNVLRIRLAEDERAGLDGAASVAGLETSTWARAVLTTVRVRPLPQSLTEAQERAGLGLSEVEAYPARDWLTSWWRRLEGVPIFADWWHAYTGQDTPAYAKRFIRERVLVYE